MGKAQVTLFVIIGIAAVILVSAVLFYVYNEKIKVINSDQTVDYSKQIQPVTNYVDSCIEKISLDAMSKLGEQGTLYPNVYIANDDRKIAYFYFKGASYFPEKASLEREFSDYIRDNIKDCLGDFSKTNFVVEDVGKDIAVSTEIQDNKISVSMDYPIKVYYGANIIPAEKFNAEIDTDFSGIYNLSQKIFTETEKNPDWINLESIQDTRYNVRLIKVDASTLVYEITDENGLENKPFKYTFAVKYDM